MHAVTPTEVAGLSVRRAGRRAGWFVVTGCAVLAACTSQSAASTSPSVASRAAQAEPVSPTPDGMSSLRMSASPTERTAVSAPSSVDSASFAPGGCLRYPGTSPHSPTVFLDAGHGGLDPGTPGQTTTGRTVWEKTITLALGMKTAADLRAVGLSVVVSRADTSVARLNAADINGTLPLCVNLV